MSQCPDGYSWINNKCVRNPTPPAPNDLIGENPVIEPAEDSNEQKEDEG